MQKKIASIINESVKIKEALASREAGNIEHAAGIIANALRTGGKLIVFGNGGSAADSQHMVAEFTGRFKRERRPLAAIALTTNTSSLTAIANDYGYDTVFSRQIEALGKKGDVAIGISTSGNSANVVEAVKKATALGIKTIGILGCEGGALKSECDLSIVVPSGDTPRIQESHLLVIHIICELVEEAMAK